MRIGMTKTIILIRHGIPEESTERGDYYRALTPMGALLQEKATELLLQYIPHLDHLYSSPLVRAQETAAIIAKRYNIEAKLHAAFGLPSDREKAFVLLDALPEHSSTAIVSHGPTIALLLHHLKIDLRRVLQPAIEVERSSAVIVTMDADGLIKARYFSPPYLPPP